MKKDSELINPRLAVPLPQQLKEILVEKIRAGEYIPGEKIPSERDLAEKFGISRISARQALTEMIAEDYLFRIPGKGTFVERADQVARKLKRGSFSVAFLINSEWYCFVQPGYSRILEGVERALRKRGYKLIFLTRDAAGNRGPSGLELQRKGPDSYDGFILVGPTEESVVQRFLAAGTPFILLDAPTSVPNVTVVSMDYFEGTRQAVNYLVKLGHRDIGYIGLEESEKYLGYLDGLKKAQLKKNAQFVEFIVLNGEERAGFQHGREAMQRLLEAGEIPTALYVTNDVVALGVMEALRKEGLQVPKDLSLIGCDDIDIYAQAEPPLTTVCTDLEEFGATAVQKLFTLMEDPRQEAHSIKVPLQMVIRGSAGPRSKVPEHRRAKDRETTRSR